MACAGRARRRGDRCLRFADRRRDRREIAGRPRGAGGGAMVAAESSAREDGSWATRSGGAGRRRDARRARRRCVRLARPAAAATSRSTPARACGRSGDVGRSLRVGGVPRRCRHREGPAPGVVSVPAGARVIDVLKAAGGPLPGADLAMLNLARKVADGELVAVGVPVPAAGVPAAAGDTGEPAGAGPAGPAGRPEHRDIGRAGHAAGRGTGAGTTDPGLADGARPVRRASTSSPTSLGIGDSRMAQLRDLVRV